MTKEEYQNVAILHLHIVFVLFHISTILTFYSFHIFYLFYFSTIRVSSIPSLLCTVSHLYRISSLTCLISTVFHLFYVWRSRLFPKLSDFVSSSSHVSKSIMFDKSRNVGSKLYPERTAYLLFQKLLLRSDIAFNLFINNIFTLFFLTCRI